MSPTLATFVAQLEAGEEELPRPFPESEWAMIFGCAFADERFNELVNTWANLRVLLHVNFPDIEVAPAPTPRPGPGGLPNGETSCQLAARPPCGLPCSTTRRPSPTTHRPPLQHAELHQSRSPT